MNKNWQPAETVPLNTKVHTKLEGEEGENICFARRLHFDEPIEWIELGAYGRTTVTHHSFAAPSHWAPYDE